MQDFSLPLIKKEEIKPGVWLFYFDRKNSDFTFTAGQTVKMTLPIENPDIRGRSRTFSISSSPLQKEYILILTRIIQSSFKKTLHVLPLGTHVRFFGPIGRFVFGEESPQKYIFLAGGIGIAGFRSLLHYAHEKKLSIPIFLFASFSSPEEIIFKEEFEKISANNSNIHVIYTISRPETSEVKWSGETGRITKELIERYTLFNAEAKFYIAGPPGMVLGMHELLITNGISPLQIHKESFVGY